jgi:hypothetical protein
VLNLLKIYLGVVMINTYQLLEDVEFRRFISKESVNYHHKKMKNRKELKKTDFIKIMTLAQYGQAHEFSLYASIKRDFKEIRFHKEVTENYPFIFELSQKYSLSERTVILALITSIIIEINGINYREIN